MLTYAANLATETNTFSPLPTLKEHFEEVGLYHTDVSRYDPNGFHGIAITKWKELAQAKGCTYFEGLAAFAQPAGKVGGELYNELKTIITDQISALVETPDIILLSLHGAMVAENCDDCEGDILSTIRRMLPNAVVGALLDPHCHLTAKMANAADILITYKEYPHTDIVDRAEELFRLCHDTAHGKITPTKAIYDCNTIGIFPTTVEPMRSFVDQLKAVEKLDGVLSASMAHGFPWADVKDVGAKVLVITDNDPERGMEIAADLGSRFFSIRETLFKAQLSLEDVFSKNTADQCGLTVVADVADNAGGGAPSDSSFILKYVLENHIQHCAIGCFWAPKLAETCCNQGPGSQIEFSIGGKHGQISGPTLHLSGTIIATKNDHKQTGLSGSEVNFGKSAWIRVHGVDIVVVSKRNQVFAPDAFTGIGINLNEKKYVVVKSSFHFEAGFRPICTQVFHVSTPGVLNLDFASLPYTKRAPDYWPRVI